MVMVITREQGQTHRDKKKHATLRYGEEIAFTISLNFYAYVQSVITLS